MTNFSSSFVSFIKDVAKDIVDHFEARQKVFEGKAMIVGMTRNICVRLYNEIIALKPQWHKHQIMTLHFFIYIQSVHTWGVKSCQPHITNND
jgi:type I site-specific restriction-modification system R (restriction) subunit